MRVLREHKKMLQKNSEELPLLAPSFVIHLVFFVVRSFQSVSSLRSFFCLFRFLDIYDSWGFAELVWGFSIQIIATHRVNMSSPHQTSFQWYCWWLKSCTTWDVWNPINNGINYLSIGAGSLNHQQHHLLDYFPEVLERQPRCGWNSGPDSETKRKLLGGTYIWSDHSDVTRPHPRR